MFFSSKGATLCSLAQFICRKETQEGEKGQKKGVLELVFDWCISIRILMRQVYINPVFSKFGTANLLLSAKPSPFG